MLLFLFLLELTQIATAQEKYFRLHQADRTTDNVCIEDLHDPLQFTFRSRNQQIVVSATDLVRWGAWQPPQQCSVLWLADGSWIVGRIQIENNSAKVVDNDWLQPITIPLALCRGMIVTAPIRAVDWHRLQVQMESVTGDKDFVWLNDGRKISGILVRPPSSTETTPEEPPSTALAIEASGRRIELDMDAEVQAIAFSPALHRKMPVSTRAAAIALRDGSLLHFSRVSELASGKLKLHLDLPIEVESRDDVARFAPTIDYVAGAPQAVTWLSDIEPTLYRHLPTSSLHWELGRNKDIFGRPLSIADSFVSKGLAMHSPSQAAFRWDGKPGKFIAEIIMAAPPEVTSAALGSVQCKVLLVRDGKLIEASKLQMLRSRDLSMMIEADITGAQSVVLITDQADAGSFADHVLWLDARFVRMPAPVTTHNP